jgi:hypothetical protein
MDKEFSSMKAGVPRVGYYLYCLVMCTEAFSLH